MSKIIFVGLHNKPGMKPLDIRTKSGKLIDRVVDPLRHRGKKVLLTNLFDIERMPLPDEIDYLAFDWIERVKLLKDDTVVLLGQMVQDNFPLPLTNVIKAAHPASKRSHIEMNKYVDELLNQLSPTK